MTTMRVTPFGRTFLDISMLRHLSKMIGTCLWMDAREDLALYANLLNNIVSQQPRALEVLDKPDLDRFLYTMNCLAESIDPTPWAAGPEEPVASITLPRPPQNERDMQDMLLEDTSLLGCMCDSSKIERLERESEAFNGGRIDISFTCGRTVHAVELKLKQADHKVVGQIAKYMRFLGSFIHYGHYEEVSGWVAAPDFQEDAARELASMGIKMIRLGWKNPR